MSFELTGSAKNVKHSWKAIPSNERFNDVTNYNTANMWAVNITNSLCGALLSFACHLKASVPRASCYENLLSIARKSRTLLS